MHSNPEGCAGYSKKTELWIHYQGCAFGFRALGQFGQKWPRLGFRSGKGLNFSRADSANSGSSANISGIRAAPQILGHSGSSAPGNIDAELHHEQHRSFRPSRFNFSPLIFCIFFQDKCMREFLLALFGEI